MKTATDKIQSVPLADLFAHPNNPNRMSKSTFAKLVRNIERTGRYEPILVRPHPNRAPTVREGIRSCFEIINGHHRCDALKQLGRERANVIVWDVDDEQTDILLATLNRLGGSDVLDKKLALLKRLNRTMAARELSKLLPQTAKQIERLIALKLPTSPAKSPAGFAAPLIFFLSSDQQRVVKEALSLAGERCSELGKLSNATTAAGRNAVALTAIAQYFLEGANHRSEGK